MRHDIETGVNMHLRFQIEFENCNKNNTSKIKDTKRFSSTYQNFTIHTRHFKTTNQYHWVGVLKKTFFKEQNNLEYHITLPAVQQLIDVLDL